MLDDLAGRRTGERIQVLRERKGLSRPTLAGLVGKSASWLKGIENGRRLPPRLPTLVRLAEVLGVGDVALLAGTDMDIGDAASIPLTSFARIPHEAVPAIREAVRAPLLTVSGTAVDVAGLADRVAQAWRMWHGSPTPPHRRGPRPAHAHPGRSRRRPADRRRGAQDGQRRPRGPLRPRPA
ncbi:helix-turn-helix domain-containing protein [Actinomadura fibrosa]|uniref:Helix-turn-helix domain-containing protein n=1 Tax=Actinomadura fibrosa TaxID=111802 RepID=A0ABW2XMF8_9ACTN|nr:helix-turn-helix transcriptional regulator [Actinomadura fibrosa]